jgi:hypothetical protein
MTNIKPDIRLLGDWLSLYSCRATGTLTICLKIETGLHYDVSGKVKGGAIPLDLQMNAEPILPFYGSSLF